MPRFNTEHGTIYYEIIDATGRSVGESPQLVLLHNFMSTGRAAWGPMIDSLAREYRILLPDLPGHGQSVGYPDNFDHGVIAQQMAALLHAEGATDAHLVGCSSGGMIAQLLVHHGIVNGLVDPTSLTLVSTTYSNRRDVIGSAGLSPSDFTASRAWLAATARLHDPYHYADSYRDSYASDGNGGGSGYTGYYENVLLTGFRRLRLDTTIDLPLDELASWTLPVCLIHGERDEFFRVGIAENMAATLSDVVLHVVPDQSHALIFRQPWKVLRLMQFFLARLPASQTQSGIQQESDCRQL